MQELILDSDEVEHQSVEQTLSAILNEMVMMRRAMMEIAPVVTQIEANSGRALQAIESIDSQLSELMDSPELGIVDAIEFLAAVSGEDYGKELYMDTCVAVFDVDSDTRIRGVLDVNRSAGWVLVADLPIRPNEYGHIQSHRIQYAKIVEFKDNEMGPGSFHCYGRISE